ncbi:hypothetical protein J2S41_004843 [Catenuloplanes atrovinosus]|uniref:Uncharacterized protein n=1 Tax=Catenuloplanes atrovinosus TaxID=137266 RepID=A0AAE3YSZ8_9ACTN|nr:hypothetical protein [Catenuloplanes atrovinosus]
MFNVAHIPARHFPSTRGGVTGDAHPAPDLRR